MFRISIPFCSFSLKIYKQAVDIKKIPKLLVMALSFVSRITDFISLSANCSERISLKQCVLVLCYRVIVMSCIAFGLVTLLFKQTNV